MRSYTKYMKLHNKRLLHLVVAPIRVRVRVRVILGLGLAFKCLLHLVVAPEQWIIIHPQYRGTWRGPPHSEG